MPMYKVMGTIAYPLAVMIEADDEDDAYDKATFTDDFDIEEIAEYNTPLFDFFDIEEVEDYV